MSEVSQQGVGNPLAPGLYLVATPIGNREDISMRALHVLRHADVIAAEDTRHSGPLLKGYGIATPLIAHHAHNEAASVEGILPKLRAGGRVALISDAGMPLVSDPGGRLVAACVAEGIDVTAVPGANAVLTAWVLSGIEAERFLFAGFLPSKSGDRRREIASLSAVPAALIFYESPQRLPETLADLAAGLGPRPVAVARELTKMHEEVVRGSLPDLAARYGESGPPRGEIVIVVGPPGEAPPPSESALDDALRTALATLRIKDAANLVAGSLGLPRQQVYARALALKDEAPR